MDDKEVDPEDAAAAWDDPMPEDMELPEDLSGRFFDGVSMVHF